MYALWPRQMVSSFGEDPALQTLRGGRPDKDPSVHVEHTNAGGIVLSHGNAAAKKKRKIFRCHGSWRLRAGQICTASF